jgi:hypothetical protein
MNDDQIEDLLRSVRPAGPPPHLRARILASRPSRAWPWLAAAAALLVTTAALQLSAGELRQEIHSAVAAAQPTEASELDAVRERFGSDQLALQAALLRREFDALARTEATQEPSPR